MHHTDKYSQNSSPIWPVCLNGWSFVYELSVCGLSPIAVTKLSYKKNIFWKFIRHRNEETQILMNKKVYLGLPVLELSKIELYEIFYHYVKPKYGENGKLCYMDTDSFIAYIKAEDIYADISKDVKVRFDASNHELD